VLHADNSPRCRGSRRAADAAVGEEGADYVEGNPDEPFLSLPHNGTEFRGELLPPTGLEEWVPYRDGEGPWQMTGAEMPE
jgi:hypothetical protein